MFFFLIYWLLFVMGKNLVFDVFLKINLFKCFHRNSWKKLFCRLNKDSFHSIQFRNLWKSHKTWNNQIFISKIKFIFKRVKHKIHMVFCLFFTKHFFNERWFQAFLYLIYRLHFLNALKFSILENSLYEYGLFSLNLAIKMRLHFILSFINVGLLIWL